MANALPALASRSERPPRAPKFSDTLDRTEASRTIVGVGLFNLGLGVHDKGTARDDRLMQWTTGIEQSPQGIVHRSDRHLGCLPAGVESGKGPARRFGRGPGGAYRGLEQS